GVLCQIVDVTGRRQLEDRLRHLADHDSLTGLINRRRFEEELERHVSHGRRYGMDGALLVLDLDGFKDVNDQYGHRAGDRVLAGVAAVLRNRLRATDVVARFGGDEFAVLLPHAQAPEATNVAKTIAEAIASEVTVPGGHLSASVGFALFEEGVLSPDDVLSAADAAMYAKKGGGRPGGGGGGRHLRPVD
ncbi:MAG: GGDEF domain-containing protein, partial [Thermoleophilia bacterium]